MYIINYIVVIYCHITSIWFSLEIRSKWNLFQNGFLNGEFGAFTPQCDVPIFPSADRWFFVGAPVPAALSAFPLIGGMDGGDSPKIRNRNRNIMEHPKTWRQLGDKNSHPPAGLIVFLPAVLALSLHRRLHVFMLDAC